MIDDCLAYADLFLQQLSFYSVIDLKHNNSTRAIIVAIPT